MIACKLCGKQMKGLTLHLLKIHHITPANYILQFPGSVMFSSETLNDPKFGGKCLKGKKAKPFTDEHRAKLAEARRKIIGWTHTDETKHRMSEAWNKPNRVERIAAMSARSGSELNRAHLSRIMKAKIERDGFHLKRGKVTSLEAIVHKALDKLGLEYNIEHRSHIKINGVYRYYDVYVPSLNLIIEADGEYWHMLDGKIEIDKLKANAIKAEGLLLLRLSDRYDKALFHNLEKLCALISSSADVISNHTATVMFKREAALAQRVVLA